VLKVFKVLLVHKDYEVCKELKDPLVLRVYKGLLVHKDIKVF
jgi:hypothetical protein